MKEIKKTYLSPNVKVKKIQAENFMAASPSISISDKPADDSPVLSKENTSSSVWDEDEDEDAE